MIASFTIEAELNKALRPRCTKTKMVLSAFIAFLMFKPTASVSSPGPRSRRISANSRDVTSFPNSEIVLDMIALSNAVYYLRNKVSSCTDPRAKNPTIVSSTGREFLSGLISDESDWVDQKRRLDENTQETENIFDTLLPEGITCLHYSHDYDIGTQVLVVRSSLRNYVSVVYAGTDDFTTALMDGDILMGKFGPSSASSNNTSDEINKLFEQVPEEAHVHRGFNSAVFDSDNFSEVVKCVTSARVGGSCQGADKRNAGQISLTEPSGSKTYKLYTTGHSLGAADSVILGAALHLAFPKENIQSINFGCPKIGNIEWVSWVDSLEPAYSNTVGDANQGGTYEIFRFVNKMDLVPRLPELVFQHAGHTLQMSFGGEIRAYYNHYGNDDLGYAGVSLGWGAEPYVLLPVALYNHHHDHYLEFLQNCAPKSDSSSTQDEPLYFVREFEPIETNSTIENAHDASVV